MANVDRVNGFRLVDANGGVHNARVKRYNVAAAYATALFIGDAVKLGGSADATGVATVEQAAAGDSMVGVIVGIDVDKAVPATEHPGYIPASTGGYVLVCDDPSAVYEVQEDGNIGVAGVGQVGDHVVAAGNTTFGTSGMELASTTVGTTGAGWHVLGYAQRPDNEIGTNAKLLVMINEHSRTGAGVGV
jgi:hypothetical protein